MVQLKFGFKRGIFPCWAIGDWRVNLWQFEKALKLYSNMRYGEKNLQFLNRQGFEMSKHYNDVCIWELKSWIRNYSPPHDFKKSELKTVLDVGAGCGETALFYHNYCGAKKVICIDSDVVCQDYLKKNAGKVDWMEVIPESFSMKHLEIPHQFLKMDIEGGELLLLKDEEYLSSNNVVLEAHSQELIEKFEKLGFKKVEALYRKNIVVMRNY